MTEASGPTTEDTGDGQVDGKGVIHFRRAQFERELAVIRASGAHTMIEKLLRPTTFAAAKSTHARLTDPAPTKYTDAAGQAAEDEQPQQAAARKEPNTAGLGRPRRLAVDVFLTATMLTIGQGKGRLTDVHATLTRGLARSYRIALGVTTPGKGLEPDRSITIRQVRYLLDAIARRLDTNPLRTTGIDDHERADRTEALRRISDTVLAATMPVHAETSVQYAVDASGIASWARGKRRSAKKPGPGKKPAVEPAVTSPLTPSDSEITFATEETDVGRAFDWDAAWGYQTLTFDKATKFVFGSQAIAVARVFGDLPLVERLRLAPANTNGVPEAVKMITDWQRERAEKGAPPIKTLLADLGFTYATPENWGTQLREAGIEQVMDIHPNDHGVEEYNGIKMIDGKPHHPAIPEELWVIPRPKLLSPTLPKNPSVDKQREYDNNVKALAEFQQLIARRAVYQLRRMEGPYPDGKERYEFPCCAGQLKDPACPDSMDLPDGTPEVTYPETVKPRPHRRTMTIPGNVQEKLRQRLTWGSPKWIDEYTKRGAIEGQFGNWKNSATENVKRGWIHVVGLAKTWLMLTLAVAHSNLRQLRAWARRNNDFSDPKTTPLPESKGFEELDAHGSLDYAPGAPPGA